MNKCTIGVEFFSVPGGITTANLMRVYVAKWLELAYSRLLQASFWAYFKFRI